MKDIFSSEQCPNELTARLDEISLLSKELLDREKQILRLQDLIINRKNEICCELNRLAKEETSLKNFDCQLAGLDEKRSRGSNTIKRSNVLVKFPEEDSYSCQGIWPYQVLDDANAIQNRIENYCTEINLKEKQLSVEQCNLQSNINKLEAEELDILEELKKEFNCSDKLQEEFQEFISNKGITSYSQHLIEGNYLINLI